MTDSHFLPGSCTPHCIQSHSAIWHGLVSLHPEEKFRHLIDSATSSASQHVPSPHGTCEESVFGEVLQSHNITVKVVRHGQVDTGSIELQFDLVVDGGLRVLVVVLEHLQGGHDALNL